MISYRSLIVVAVVLLALSTLAGDDRYDADLTKKIEVIIRESEQIKVGMTRADLLKVFTTEGGVSTRKWRRYIHQRCPYIKVDVEFEPIGEKKDRQGSPADKITKISKPFLELCISD